MKVQFVWVVLFSFLSFSNAYADQCELVFGAESTAQSSLEESAQRINQFFKSAKGYLVEREDILDLILYALIAKEHIKLLGPPGTAKTKVADVVGKHILERSGKSSFWSHQMTPETTMSETHGPYNFKTLEEENKFRRQLEEGLLSHKIVFIDEFFDGNPKTMRNILKAFNEREITEGTQTTKGILETAITTSNKPLAKVYERAGRLGDEDDPAAVLDRDAFVVFIQSEFKSLVNELKVQNLDVESIKMPEVYFDDLDSVRELVKQVEVPQHVQVFLSQLNGRMKESLELLEVKSKDEYQKKIKMGEVNPVPPYRKSKEYSPRTLNKANKILRAMVVADWIQKGGQRKLVANVDDLKKIEKMLTVSGPDDTWIDKLIGRAVKPVIRSQLEAVKVERQTFRFQYDEIQKDMNDVIVKYALGNLSDKYVEANKHGRQKEYINDLMAEYVKVLREADLDVPTWETSGTLVGHLFIREYIEDNLISILGNEKFESLKAQMMDEARDLEIQAQREAELRAEEEERRRQEENDRLKHDEIKQEVIKEYYKTRGIDLISELPVEDKISDVRLRALNPNRNEYAGLYVYQSGNRPLHPIGHSFFSIQNNQIISNGISKSHYDFVNKLRLLNLDQATELIPAGRDWYIVLNNENSSVGIFNQRNPEQHRVADFGSKKFDVTSDDTGENLIVLDYQNSKVKIYNVIKDEIVTEMNLNPEDQVSDLWIKFKNGTDTKDYVKRFPTEGKNEILVNKQSIYVANRRNNNLYEIDLSSGNIRYLTKTPTKWVLIENSNTYKGELNYVAKESGEYTVMSFDPTSRSYTQVGQILNFDKREECLNNSLNLFADKTIGICSDKQGNLNVIHLKSGEHMRKIESSSASNVKVKSIDGDRLVVFEQNEDAGESVIKLYKITKP